MNIIEYIDSILPQNIIPIFYLSLPQDDFGMLIEETGIRGSIDSFKGFDGVIRSNIQFYVKVKPENGKYKEINALLKRFYKIVQNNVGSQKENVKLLYVGQFDLTPAMRDKDNNYIFSMIYPVIYKEWSDLDGNK